MIICLDVEGGKCLAFVSSGGESMLIDSGMRLPPRQESPIAHGSIKDGRVSCRSDNLDDHACHGESLWWYGRKLAARALDRNSSTRDRNVQPAAHR